MTHTGRMNTPIRPGIAQLVGGERDGEELAVPLPEPYDLRFVRAPSLVTLDRYRDSATVDDVAPIEHLIYRRENLARDGARRYVLTKE